MNTSAFRVSAEELGMRLGVLGTGIVGNAIGTRLAQKGGLVMMGSRTANNEKARAWAKAAGRNASQGTFADAAKFGEVLFNCTSGGVSLDALKLAGEENLAGKVLVDVANPLDFSKGMPPSLTVCNTDSLAEQIQRAFPDAKVVKSLNTMNCYVMVNPGLIPGDHNVFLAGNDAGAKSKVKEVLGWFGWTPAQMFDLGDLTAARGMEMVLPLWLRLWGAFQNPNFNFHLAVGPKPPQ
jgi:predicted dinucleotide-binding enzyme